MSTISDAYAFEEEEFQFNLQLAMAISLSLEESSKAPPTCIRPPPVRQIPAPHTAPAPPLPRPVPSGNTAVSSRNTSTPPRPPSTQTRSRYRSTHPRAIPYMGPQVHPRPYAVGRCSNERYAALDKHALGCPESRTQSLHLLVEYLTQVTRNTEEAIRVLHRWVTHNISYNVEGLRSGIYGDTSADGVLRGRKGVCSGYATLFSALCKEARIEQREISGVAKGSTWEGEQLCRSSAMPDSNHAWNAVYLPEQDGWGILDCTWSAGHLASHGNYERSYKDVYFLTRPDLFVIDHLPSTPEWSLLSCPPSWLEIVYRSCGECVDK
ncbi:hypothetical protein DUNSADRAFT_8559 [Dunaliella salina]|uniref:Transglutaminase-like domain-containing protein n=1 Tax=Dunaliella salina TaxID=3046 RepID=A0ABQ7GJ87_DUNSA|nr:hypothetical protein DUNSADRAFT_8559 [Dunaliella salina]|eukprot:KAF5834677.1 hypothetical protein DUNSADRAFT_8559 [Dunaliella salina]